MSVAACMPKIIGIRKVGPRSKHQTRNRLSAMFYSKKYKQVRVKPVKLYEENKQKGKKISPPKNFLRNETTAENTPNHYSTPPSIDGSRHPNISPNAKVRNMRDG